MGQASLPEHGSDEYPTSAPACRAGGWLIVAPALYRHKSISEVLDDLCLAIPDSQTPFVSKSAVAQARQQVGSQPLKWLFERSARHWVAQDRKLYVSKGMQLFAMEGTTCARTTRWKIVTTSEPKTTQQYGCKQSSGTRCLLTSLPTYLVHSAAFAAILDQ